MRSLPVLAVFFAALFAITAGAVTAYGPPTGQPVNVTSLTASPVPPASPLFQLIIWLNYTNMVKPAAYYHIPVTYEIVDVEKVTSVSTSIGYMNVVNVTLLVNYTGALALLVVAPAYVVVCDLPYPYTIHVYYVNGTPAGGIRVCVSTDWNYTACMYSDNYGTAIFYLTPPKYGLWSINVLIGNVTVWTTSLRYLNCLFATTTTPPAPPGFVPPGPVIVVNYTNVSISWNPGGIAFPSLTSPLGIVIAGALVAIWAWLARIDIGYATIVIGYVLAALGAVYNNAALVTGGALAMVGGFILRRLKTS